MNEQEQRLDGPDLLVARVYGDDVPALQMAALDKARELYGPDARLRIEHVDRIEMSFHLARGKFWTYVHVRCLNFPGEEA